MNTGTTKGHRSPLTKASHESRPSAELTVDKVDGVDKGDEAGGAEDGWPTQGSGGLQCDLQGKVAALIAPRRGCCCCQAA